MSIPLIASTIIARVTVRPTRFVPTLAVISDLLITPKSVKPMLLILLL
jgi:hypothetical protein